MGWWYPGFTLESLVKLVQPYLAYVAVAVVGLSYIFGFVAHRLIQIINLIAERVPPIKNFFLSSRWEFVSADLEERMLGETAIWGLSPERIHRELDFQFAQVALLRSLVCSSPILALSVWFWRCRTHHHHHLFSVALYYRAHHHHPLAFTLCIVLWVLLILAYRRQSLQYEAIRGNALEAAKRHAGWLVPSLSPTFGPVGTIVTIRGINFGTAQGDNSVVFVAASTRSYPLRAKTWNQTWISVTVPMESAPGEGNFLIDLVGASDTVVEFRTTFECPFNVTK
jgi:IPT/TIG domain